MDQGAFHALMPADLGRRPDFFLEFLGLGKGFNAQVSVYFRRRFYMECTLADGVFNRLTKLNTNARNRKHVDIFPT